MQLIKKLELEKYDLSHLNTKNVRDWTNPDIEALINACEQEGIAPAVSIAFTSRNVEELLSKYQCRRCGKCCLPDPGNPDHPGILLHDTELKIITKFSNVSYKSVKKKAIKYKNPVAENTSHLPLPCMFYQRGECKIYEVRPRVCNIYPLKNEPYDGKDYISINVRCDYGKDIYRYATRSLKAKKLNPLFLYG